jgi:hypothetical protein
MLPRKFPRGLLRVLAKEETSDLVAPGESCRFQALAHDPGREPKGRAFQIAGKGLAIMELLELILHNC